MLAKADRIFKKLLFGWLPQTQSAHGAKLRWRDKVRQDLKRLGIPGSDWYCLCEDKIAWRDVCQDSTSIRQLRHMGRKAIVMVWSTTSGGKHHPLDGCTSMVQWCVCMSGCVEEDKQDRVHDFIRRLDHFTSGRISEQFLGNL